MRHIKSKIYDSLTNSLFILRGLKPWSFGYNTYKWKTIEKYLASNTFNEGNLIDNYGFRIDERVIEYPWLFSRLSKDTGTLLDAGSILNYDIILNQPHLQSKKIFISTLAPEGNCFWKKGISYVFEDLRNCCYRDSFFDEVVCISTTEHIGLDNTLLYTDDISKRENNPNTHLNAIREFYRILKPEGILYLTLPFGKKINCGWFQVFDGKMIDELITVFNPSSVIETHFSTSQRGG
jgi:hypothetical protein